MGVKCLGHSHELASNPLEYPENLKFDTDHEFTLAEVARLREAGVCHKKAHYNNGYNQVEIFTFSNIALALKYSSLRSARFLGARRRSG